MRIAVTGASGFIGSHLVERLVSEGHAVRALVLPDDPTANRVSDRATIVVGDVREADDVSNLLEKCQIAFHLAAQTDVVKSIEDPDFDYSINFIGSKNVFDAAKSGGAKVVFSSSAAVYGDSAEAVSEKSKTQPISQYGWNKLQSERICPPGSFIVRLFNVYGPRGHGVINTFCGRASNGKGIEIRGTGLQTRDYIYVDDAVDALLLGIKHSGLYNVGTGRETTVLAVAHMIESITGKKLATKYTPGIKGEIARSLSDASKIQSELGWSAKTSVKDGIKKTLLS